MSHPTTPVTTSVTTPGQPSPDLTAYATVIGEWVVDASYVWLMVAARHPSTPPDILARLARDEDSDVRWRVGLNPSTPPDILARLARDGHPDVRAAAEPPRSTHTLWQTPAPCPDIPSDDLSRERIVATLWALLPDLTTGQARVALSLLDGWTSTIAELVVTASQLAREH